MKLFYKLLYIVSTAVTILCFVFAYASTITEGSMGGNGNVGLFLFYFTFPFWLYFLYATIEYGMRRFMLIKNQRLILVFVGSVIVYNVIVWSVVITKATRIANALSIKPEFGYSVGILQSYTNGLFFNLFTFISVVGICLAIGALWANKRKKVFIPSLGRFK